MILSPCVFVAGGFSALCYWIFIVAGESPLRRRPKVAVLNQLLIRSGREDQAMMTTLAGLVVVLSILVKQISTLFVTIKALFSL